MQASPPKVVIVEQYDGAKRKETVVWSRRNRVKQIFFVGGKCFVVFKEPGEK